MSTPAVPVAVVRRSSGSLFVMALLTAALLLGGLALGWYIRGREASVAAPVPEERLRQMETRLEEVRRAQEANPSSSELAQMRAELGRALAAPGTPDLRPTLEKILQRLDRPDTADATALRAELEQAKLRQRTMAADYLRDSVNRFIWPGNISIRALALSPGATRVAVGSEKGVVHVWDRGTAREVARLEGHLGPVTSLAFSADGTQLASASGREIRVWDIATSKGLRTSQAADAVAALRFTGAEPEAIPVPPPPAGLRTSVQGRRLLLHIGSDEHELFGGPAPVMAFGPDGRSMAVADGDRVRVWLLPEWLHPLRRPGL